MDEWLMQKSERRDKRSKKKVVKKLNTDLNQLINKT